MHASGLGVLHIGNGPLEVDDDSHDRTCALHPPRKEMSYVCPAIRISSGCANVSSPSALKRHGGRFGPFHNDNNPKSRQACPMHAGIHIAHAVCSQASWRDIVTRACGTGKNRDDQY